MNLVAQSAHTPPPTSRRVAVLKALALGLAASMGMVVALAGPAAADPP